MQQTLTLKDNKLTARANVDSMRIYLTYRERNKEEQKVQTIETVIEKEVNVLKWWQKALMWIGVTTIAYAFFRIIILNIKSRH